MATIQVPLSDDKILDLLQQKYGLDTGQGRVRSIDVQFEPPTANTTVSHIVSVQVSFGLELGEINDLVGF